MLPERRMVDELKFRNLVTNQFMENIDYSREKYSFLTVFYTSSSTYCCCSCAHNHEYLEYISDTGQVDENMYENIVNSLAKGRCPHADTVPDYQLRPTSITAMHIAAAVGMARAVIENRYICFSYAHMRVGRIFNLYPFDTAMLKKQTNICNLLAEYWLSHGHGPISVPYISTVKDISLHVKEVSRLEFCVRQRNNHLLQAITTSFSKIPGFGGTGLRNINLILVPRTGLAHALQLTMKHQLVELQQTLVQFMELLKNYYLLSKELRNDCLLSVLMYNEHKLLDQMLTFLDSNDDIFISKCCIVLQKRGECTNLLQFHHNIRPVSMSKEEHIHTLFTLFCMFYHDFKDELYRLLETAPGIQDGFIKVSLLKQIPSFRRYYHDVCIVQLIQTIIEIGTSETLIFNTEIIVPQLLVMLKNYSTYGMCIREAIELLVNENVEINIDIENIVDGEPKVSKNVHREESYHYITDVREHGLYGHNGEDLALNYLCPFLYECGYQIPRCILLEILHKKFKKDSKSAELAYINTYLDTPRSLQTCCRNTLRKHFRGRYIHRFVEVSRCPQKIKDIILLKHLLLCLR